MKASNELWKARLSGNLPDQLADEINTFEQEIELRCQNKVDEKVFAEDSTAAWCLWAAI